MIRSLAVLSLFLLIGCEQGQPPENLTSITVANPHSDGLKALPDDLRNLGVMRAIRDNGRRCKRVESSAFQEDHKGMAMWVATCNDEREWAVFIAPNGDVQVRPCEDMETLGLPACRLPDAQPSTG